MEKSDQEQIVCQLLPKEGSKLHITAMSIGAGITHYFCWAVLLRHENLLSTDQSNQLGELLPEALCDSSSCTNVVFR